MNDIERAKKLLESNGYTVSEKLAESAKIDFKKLESEIRDKVKEVMLSPEFGFTDEGGDAPWNEYSVVEIRDGEDQWIVEVRAEMSYDGEMMMCDALDPIIAKYDKDAYFEPDAPGIIDAYIEK